MKHTARLRYRVYSVSTDRSNFLNITTPMQNRRKGFVMAALFHKEEIAFHTPGPSSPMQLQGGLQWGRLFPASSPAVPYPANQIARKNVRSERQGAKVMSRSMRIPALFLILVLTALPA